MIRNPGRELRKAEDLHSRGVRLANSGAHAAAERALGKAVRLYDRLFHSANPVLLLAGLQWDMGVTLWRLAGVVSVLGRLDEAARYCSQAVAAMSSEFERRQIKALTVSETASLRTSLATCLTDLSIFECATGRADEAVSAAYRAVDLLTDQSGEEKHLATAYHALAQAHLAEGMPNRANTAIRAALVVRERAADAEPGPTLATYELASSLLVRAEIYAVRGDRLRALGHVERVEGMLDDLGAAALPLLAKAAELRPRLER